MKKVLVVDDAAFMRITLKEMLESNGYEVAGEASNGIEAVRKYITLKPDIVTMDITMPEMDGVDALIEIRKHNPAAKIIMISALGQESWVRKAVMQGAKGFVVKPFNEECLVKALMKV
jgi:two-component system chemotaxis response regulator CheY